VDDAKLSAGFEHSEDVCASIVGFLVAGACPNNVLNDPAFDVCIAGAELPKFLPGVADVAGVCPNGLVERLKTEVDWLNSEFEEEGALAG
jgi:hypothetical protein